MPHQWLEGNLPVASKCIICDKTCGSVLRLQDWRCLWCRATVHTQCRPHLAKACPLGPARVSVLPPTALHSVSDEAWEAVRPQASSPLLVFVNSKSGDNQGVKFLRRFKQLLNPAQVFDLISTGPRLGLRLFRHFDPFRILVCSGDGSVGWVLSEIDKLDMHKQCQVAVLPLGTGNDLARVLGWGASCDDDTHLPQLLEKYERASTKMLDRWSIMTFERTIAIPKLSLDTTQPEGQLHSQICQYEESLINHLQNILQSDETSVVLNSAKRLCETVKDFATQVTESGLARTDDSLGKKCEVLQHKLELLMHTLTSEQLDLDKFVASCEDATAKCNKDDTESEASYDKSKVEKELSNFNFRRHSCKQGIEITEKKQCQVAVLPLGTGNDLARVLGWGASCDDDTHLPQLLEKYERASTKMLDRWSIMTFERTIAIPKLSLDTTQPEGQLHSQICQYEESLINHLQNILQSDETSVVLNSAKRLCETVKDFATQVTESGLARTDDSLGKKCEVLQHKLELLMHTLTSEQLDLDKFVASCEDATAKCNKDDTESEASYDKSKVEKELSNFNFRRHRRTSRFMEREKDALMVRANSLKRAIRSLVEHTEQVVDEQNRQSTTTVPTVKISLLGSSSIDRTTTKNIPDVLYANAPKKKGILGLYMSSKLLSASSSQLLFKKQCQVAVLPLGTGNDLARVLGWGASCDDDTHLPQLLEKYERASTKMLDRWSIMTFERTIAIPKLSLDTTQPEGQLHSQICQYEESLINHLQNILQSDETSVVLNSAKRLCETVKDFATQVTESGLARTDDSLGKKCEVLQHKLELLMHTLTSEQLDLDKFVASCEDATAKCNKDDTESEASYDKSKVEKELSNFNFRRHRRTSRFMEREKDALMVRANSLKRAIRSLVEHTEQVVDEQNRQSTTTVPTVKISLLGSSSIDRTTTKNIPDDLSDGDHKMTSLKVLPTVESGSSTDISPCPSPSSQSSSVITAKIVSISPMPDVRRESTCDDPVLMQTLPVPPDFADSRRASQVQSTGLDESTTIETLLASTSKLKTMEQKGSGDSETITNEQLFVQQRRRSSATKDTQDIKIEYKATWEEEKECSSIASNEEEMSFPSEIIEPKSFCPRKDSDGEDVNGHIYHIDSPETDTYPTSEALHGESLMDDISSVGQDLYGFDQDSIENTYSDDTTLFASEIGEPKKDKIVERKRSFKRIPSEKKRRSSCSRIDEITQFGFENKLFMQHNKILDNRFDKETVRYCSLAQFVEGNDIARRSFKRRNTSKKVELIIQRQSTVIEEREPSIRESRSSLKDSKTSLNKIEKETSNISVSFKNLKAELEESLSLEANSGKAAADNKSESFRPVFPQVIVEPPSPIIDEEARGKRLEYLQTAGDYDSDSCYELHIKSSEKKSGDSSGSVNSFDSNLHPPLEKDYMHFLSCSPAATRRISSCSLLNPAEASVLQAAAASKRLDDNKERKIEKEKKSRKLPIINPLVMLPTWPNVSSGAGFISKCLLANADTLCAAVSPLMDPDETLLEGFFERCVMNNYFGIGIDAKISLDFHHKREEHPEKCRSRAKNYMWYGVLGSKQWLQKTYKNLEQRVQLECDGQKIPLPSLQGIVILNIPSFMGGINFWGGTKEDDIFLAPSFDDKILEVVAVFGSVQMAASRLINLQHHRIAQCQSIQINILGDEGVPIQVDGEAWIQPPGIIRILHKNRMQMLCRNRALENSLKTWEEKQRHQEKRLSISHDKTRSSLTRQSMPNQEKSFLTVPTEKIRQHSFSGAVPVLEKSPSISFDRMPPSAASTREPELLFSDEEHALLLAFIECATTLTKWIKILAISYDLEVDLYSLANKADKCLECIHPNGKLLEGPSLRVEFTKLVNTVKHLYEDSCNLLHDRGDKLKLRDDIENKLSISLANMEMELRKCFTYENSAGNLVYLQSTHDDQGERKRKGLFWLKLRTRGSVLHSQQQAKDVASWGTHEVATWLETLQLSEYIDSFVKNDIRGRELLTLARRDLKDLGVTKVGHVKRILQAVKDLSQGA
ncbi:diacylglycerol kinase eta [Agrilus planipennis]|uniref:Diacylglycerol kinase n=1 Tax=Agrilus planipennis TaxID=224129 RepID=A0A7F5RCI9_AGRPL|nr:diacylglycerol kinase eta [Agrilus planipennis]